MNERNILSNRKPEAGITEISRIIALVSFVIGTLILTLFYWTENLTLTMVGLFYLVLAFIINSVFLVGLVIKLINKESDKKQVLISIGLMLINIPIVILYYNIAMEIIAIIPD